MTNREIILGRVREALKIAAPHPAFHQGTTTSPLPASPQQWLPQVGETLEEQIELFRKNAEKLQAGFHICADMNEAVGIIKALAAKDGWKKIGSHHGELTDAVTRELDLIKVLTDDGYVVNDLESCDA